MNSTGVPTLARVVLDRSAADCEVDGPSRRDVTEDHAFGKGIVYLESGHSG